MDLWYYFQNILHKGVNGWLTPRVANEIKWNRTVNLVGGEGRNIEMDLCNEFLNNEFKGMFINICMYKKCYTPCSYSEQ